MATFDIVTGGAGFIGSHLVDALLAQGRPVRAIDDLSIGRRSNLSQHDGNPNFRFVEASVADRARLTESLSMRSISSSTDLISFRAAAGIRSW